MNIGFMDPREKPTLIAKTTAIMAAHYGVTIVYFNPKDVNLKNNVITGKEYKNNKWVQVKRKLPPLVDVSSKSIKKDTQNIINYLKKNTILTFDKKGTPSKEKLQLLLKEDSMFSHLVIPTKKIESFDLLEKFLTKYKLVILKPNKGKQGKGIYSLQIQDKSYILSHGKNEKKINRKELIEFYNKHLLKNEYLMQKMIISQTNEGSPFDSRIIVQKNSKGKWSIGMIFFRIGIGQKVVSNISQGGSFSFAKAFLKTNYEDKWESIYKKLKEVALTLPYKFEEIKGTPTMELGLDIGIDSNGDLYLFEINNGASVDLLLSKSARLRLEYYRYLIETHPELKKIKKNMKKIDLEKERDFYKNEYHKLINSKSWRLTMPIRKISSYLKK